MENLMVVVFIMVTFLLGLVFGVTLPRKQKFDGTLEVSEKDASQIHTLEIDTDPDDLKNQNVVRFRVKKIPES